MQTDTPASSLEQKLLRALMLFKRTTWHHKSIEGYKPSEIKALLCIHRSIQHAPPDMKVSDISKQLHVTAPTVTQLIKSLEAHGLIERNVDPTDRRAVSIRLTEKGKEVTQKATDTFMTTIHGLVDYLGEEQSYQLVDLLIKVTAYFNEHEIHDQDQQSDACFPASQADQAEWNGEDQA
jgi:DNA-binding MarR family transcriptional regulator